MSKLIMTPAKMVCITSKRPENNMNDAGWLFVGQSRDARYRSLLEFDLGSIINDREISKAILRVYSARGCQSRNVATVTPYYIYSRWNESEASWNNQPLINQSIKGHPARIVQGWNTLDITDIAQAWADGEDNNFGLMLKSDEACEDMAGLNMQQYGYMPSLLLYSQGTGHQDNEGCFYEVYPVCNQIGYSHWKQSCTHTMYTFFVQNVGSNEVRLNVQISPDRNAIIDEAEQFTVMPGQTEAIVTQKFAYFTRLAFNTVSPHARTSIKVWFQPLVNDQ